MKFKITKTQDYSVTEIVIGELILVTATFVFFLQYTMFGLHISNDYT